MMFFIHFVLQYTYNVKNILHKLYCINILHNYDAQKNKNTLQKFINTIC